MDQATLQRVKAVVCIFFFFIVCGLFFIPFRSTSVRDFVQFRLIRNDNGPISCIRFRAMVAILMIIPVCLRLLQRGGGTIVKSGNTKDLLLSCEWNHYEHVLRRESILSVEP
jgi:preprotein translocase subunit SecG